MVYFIIQRGNCFSMNKSLLLYIMLIHNTNLDLEQKVELRIDIPFTYFSKFTVKSKNFLKKIVLSPHLKVRHPIFILKF